MIQQAFAASFAREWINAWNTHDIDGIMVHYSENIVFMSPVIKQVNDDPSGCIKTKKDLRDYFAKALKLYPELQFTLQKVLISVNSIVLYYDTIDNMVTAEYMEIDRQGKVIKVCAHYSK